MAKHILLLNGPNLNLLGTREPHIYGSSTLSEVIFQAEKQASELSLKLSHFQSNHSGALVDRIHTTRDEGVDAIVINAGGLTHTDVALRDALTGVGIPFVEVHVTNVHRREGFRHQSFLSDKAEAVVAGMGIYGYSTAIEFTARHLKIRESAKL
ncbi:MAG: Catabolic 3-dehydroquinase 2 [Bogoriella megaspora]|nr:MAG: Catabolic 3-dehydroquinase 2 [Bogoriella megaspora]